MKKLIIDKSKNWTVEEFEKLGEEFTCQVIDGVLYNSPTPTVIHQRVSSELLHIFYPFHTNSFQVLLGPLDIHVDNRTILKSDIMVVSDANQQIIQEIGIYGAPDIVVEILSPLQLIS